MIRLILFLLLFVINGYLSQINDPWMDAVYYKYTKVATPQGLCFDQGVSATHAVITAECVVAAKHVAPAYRYDYNLLCKIPNDAKLLTSGCERYCSALVIVACSRSICPPSSCFIDAAVHFKIRTCIYKYMNESCGPRCEKASKNCVAPSAPSCTWNDDLANNSREYSEREMATKGKEMILRTFDEDGNIVIHGSFPETGSFPVLLKQPNARFILEVCDIPGSQCDSLESGAKMQLLVYKESRHERDTSSPCDVHVDTPKLHENGSCWTGMWNLKNKPGAYKIRMEIKESSSNCRLTVKIKSSAVETCYMIWQNVFSFSNAASSPVVVTKTYKHGVSTTKSWTESRQKKNGDEQTHRTDEERIQENRTKSSTHNETQNLEKFEQSAGVTAKAGASVNTKGKYKANADGQAGLGKYANASGHAEVDGTYEAEAGASAEAKLEAKHGQEWNDISNTDVSLENKDSTRNAKMEEKKIYSESTMTKSESFSTTEFKEEALSQASTVQPGESLGCDQLVISCTHSTFEMKTFRYYSDVIYSAKKRINDPNLPTTTARVTEAGIAKVVTEAVSAAMNDTVAETTNDSPSVDDTSWIFALAMLWAFLNIRLLPVPL